MSEAVAGAPSQINWRKLIFLFSGIILFVVVYSLYELSIEILQVGLADRAVHASVEADQREVFGRLVGEPPGAPGHQRHREFGHRLSWHQSAHGLLLGLAIGGDRQPIPPA